MKQLKPKPVSEGSGFNWSLLMIVSVLAVSACSPLRVDPEEFPTVLPCDQPAQQVELGSPHKEDPPATFTVDGRTVWVTIGRGLEGGPLSDVDLAALSIGHQERPPSYDAVSGRVENEEMNVIVHVGRFTELNPAAGNYWMLLSQGGDLELHSCEPDVISNPDRSR